MPNLIESWSHAGGGLRLLRVVAVIVPLLLLGHALAQEVTIPTVGDSPSALQLCRRAEDLRDTNPEESARIVQRVLSEYADRLVPADEGADRFVPASARVLALVGASPRVRAEWEKALAPTIERLRESGDDRSLARVAPSSPEGLRAALRNAQRDLEAGRAAAALVSLRHVDDAEMARFATPRERGFARAMRARALHRLGDRAAAERESAALEVLAATDPALEPIAAALRRESALVVDTPRANTAIDPVAPWHRIWSLPLPNAPYTRRYLNPLTGPLLNMPTAAQAAEDGSLLTVWPLAAGDRIFINEGHVISAIDRLSRRVQWQRVLAIDDGDVLPIGDLSEMALDDDTLYVLTGHGSATRRTGGGRLVALDANTGAVRWEQWLARLEPPDADGGEGLFPHGAPLVVDDTVVVMARKMNARIESVATLVGFDRTTGEPRWMTYLAGCGSRPMSSMRAFSNPVAAKGSIFVSTSLGATARIDPDRGTIRWLARFPVPVTDIARWPLPWEMSAPAIVDEGVLAIAPDGMAVLLLDVETGEVRRSFSTGAGEPWGAPRVLIASDDARFVLAIGEDVLLFDAHDLDRPRWRFSSMLAELGLSGPRAAIRGRIAFAHGLLDGRMAAVIPLADRAIVVDVERGAIARVIDTGRGGNALLVDGQVLLASGDRIECFMPLGSAERAVRDWMARDPADPTRSLALLELGIQCAVPAMIFEGVATTVAAVDRSNDEGVRSELVERLIGGALELDLPDDTMRRLIDAARATARRASDQVACAIAEGAWELRRGRPVEAAAAWQRVLVEPELRRTMIVDSDSQIAASAIVFARIAGLVPSVGPSSLAERERAAEAALRSVAATAPTDQLIEIAQAWTGTVAGVNAALRAVDALVAAGRSREAFILAAQALRDRSSLAGVDAATRSMVTAIVALAETQGWRDAASIELVALLDRTTNAGGSTQDATFVRDTLRALVPSDPSVRLWPSIGVVAEGGGPVPGRLALLTAWAEAERGNDRALFIERVQGSEQDSQAVLRDGPQLEQRWTAPVGVDDPIVLSFGDRIVLWQRGNGVESSIISLDARDGSMQWSVPVVASLFDPGRLASTPTLSRRGARDRSYLSPGEVIPLRVDQWLLLARRNGDIACIDLHDGTLRWRLDGVVEEIAGDIGMRQSLVAANAWVIAVGGTRRLADGSTASNLAFIDPARGEVIGGSEIAGELEWVSIAPGPVVLASARNEVHAFVPGRSERVWSRIDHRLGNAEPGPQAGDCKLIVATRGTRRDEIVALDLLRGTVHADGFVAPARRSMMRSNLRSLQRIGDAIVALSPDRLVLFDPSGRVVGQDAIAVDRTFGVVLPSNETLLVIDPESAITYQANPDRPVGSSSGAVLYQFSRREGGRLLADPLVVPIGDRADRWCVLTGAVVGSGTDRSVHVLMPSGAAR